MRARPTDRHGDVPSPFCFTISPVFPSNLAKMSGRGCELSGFRWTASLCLPQSSSHSLYASFLGKGTAMALGESSLGLRLAGHLLPDVTGIWKSREVPYQEVRRDSNQLPKTEQVSKADRQSGSKIEKSKLSFQRQNKSWENIVDKCYCLQLDFMCSLRWYEGGPALF